MRVVYVTTNALTSPHVQSQVLPYLGRMAQRHEFTLVTHEPRASPVPESVREHAARRGVECRSLPFRSGLSGAMAGLPSGVREVRRTARRTGAQLLHARSYVAAEVCRRVAKQLDIPWLFDMRGFYVDERVDIGLLRSGSVLYRALRRREARLLTEATGIVVLTDAARSLLEKWGVSAPIVVVPCAVDVDAFALPRPKDAAKTLLYSGSVSARYDLKEMAKVVAVWARSSDDPVFRIASRDPPELFLQALAEAGVDLSRVATTTWTPAEVPRHLVGHGAMLNLVMGGAGSVGSSPIKVAEALAAGLPVVVDRRCGDMGRLLDTTDIAVEGGPGIAAEVTAGELGAMLDRRSIRERCRHVARQWYGLDGAVDRYLSMYDQIGS